MGHVLLIGTLDTKGPEYDYLRTCLKEAGASVTLIDVGVLGEPGAVPDITAGEIAEAGGASLQSLRSAREGSDTRTVALAAMGRGSVRVVENLRARGRCDAVMAAAGSGGASVIAPVFQALPLGVPKLLVTTMGGYLESLSKTRDITLMQSVTDIAGLNRVSRQILRNAAFAAAGMASSGKVAPDEKPLVAVTMFGVTTPGVLQVERRLQAAGFETITFHAVGSGGRAMEEMIEAGLIDGVIDYTISELTDELLGGIFSAGPKRLEAAGRAGLPQVIVPGAIEVLNFGPRVTVPARFDTPERRLIVHNENVTAVRTTRAEAETLGRVVAEKVNLARGPLAVMVPLDGFDSYQQRP
ncbi:MAG: Tm-1-like ATP-binding domain-containing protein, partial [Stellaceae bacterium]